MPQTTAKKKPPIGTECWLVEWIADAEVPQTFKDDPDRDLGEAMRWERTRAFPTEPLAFAFGVTLRGLFFGCYNVKKMLFDFDPECPETGPEWLTIEHAELDENDAPAAGGAA